MKCVWLVAILMMLAVAGNAADEPWPFLTKTSGAVPDFTAQTVEGPEFASRAEAKATLIHVFACESERCETSLRALQEFLWEPLRDDGLRLVGVARDATVDETRQYAADYGLTFPLVADPDRKIAKLFAAEGKGVPRTIILNAAGEIVYQHAGFRSGREAEFRLVVKGILDGRGVPREVERMRQPPGQRQLYALDVMGKKAPELKVQTWINKPPEDVAGKFRLMEFWATWCGPCVQTMPHLQVLSKTHKDRLVIYSVSDESPEKVRAFVKKMGFSYPIGTDEEARTKDELRITGIPHAILVNPEGIVVWQGHPMVLAGDEGLLDRLLEGKSP